MRNAILHGVFSVRTLLGTAFAILLATSAHAQTEADPSAGSVAPDEPIGSTNGSFGQSIPIQVPPFRGLEPNLAISYDSNNGKWLDRRRLGPFGPVAHRAELTRLRHAV